MAAALTVPSNDLSGETIASSFDQLLILDHADGMINSALQIVSTQTGRSALQITNDQVLIKDASTEDIASCFEVQDASSNVIFSVDGNANRVGIGTNAPGASFVVSNGSDMFGIAISSTTINFREDGDSSTTAGADWFVHKYGTVTYFPQTTKIGMGTDSPATQLEVRGDTTTPGAEITISTADTVVADGDKIGAILFQAPLEAGGTDAITPAGAIWCEASDTFAADNNKAELKFATGNSSTAYDESRVAMTIDEDGFVGIGSTGPGTKLYVVADASSGFSASFINDGNNVDRHGINIRSGEDVVSGTNYYVHCRDGDGHDVGYLNHNGSSFAARAASDVRLKENIIDTTINGIETVNAIKVRDYDWKKTGVHVPAGLIANELKEIFPSAVSGEPDAVYEDGKILPMSISNDTLVPLLIKAIQELSTKVTALENA